MSQDVQFIAETVQGICTNVESQETLHKILGSANQYVQLKKFDTDKLVSMPTVVTQESFDTMSIEEKLNAVGLEVQEVTNNVQPAGDMLGGIVNKMEQQNKYRDDLKCPFCQQMVYDNRNNKKSDKSPDFVCSTNDPVTCGGHSGKWRKSWWVDNSDIPVEWNLDGEVKTAPNDAGEDLSPF